MKNDPIILLVTSKHDLAADLIFLELKRRNVSFLRLNSEEFPVKILMSWAPFAEKEIIINEQSFSLNGIKSVWFRKAEAPNLPVDIISQGSRDYLLNNVNRFLTGFWEDTNWLWINKPSKIQAGENKLYQLSIAKQLELPIPKTVITNNPKTVREFIEAHGNVIVKSIAPPVVEAENSRWGLFTHAVTLQDVSDDMSVRISPCIFQERINRKSDLRITVVGEKVFAAEIIVDDRERDNPDWRSIDPQYLKYKPFKLPAKLSNYCINFLSELGLSFGAFDFILTDNGDIVFIEVNPSGQWGWIEHETGLPITKELANLLIDGVN